MPGSTLADLGEFALIERVTGLLPRPGWPAPGLGPGDDSAVLPVPSGWATATTDLLVEGVHFRLDWSAAFDVGSKAAAQNLADLAAMGSAAGAVLLVGLAAPGTFSVHDAEQLARGIAAECGRVGAVVAGGDVVGNDRLVVSVTALGSPPPTGAVLRSGARPGDAVVVAGRLGASAAGLALLTEGGLDLAGQVPHALARHRRPEPDYPAAAALAAAGATAMIDTSDGFAADLGHVLAASGVSADIDAGRLPVGDGVAAAAALLGTDPLTWVCSGGEDHALVATIAADRVPSGCAVVGQVGYPLSSGPRLRWVGDRTPTLPTVGHQHFG